MEGWLTKAPCVFFFYSSSFCNTHVMIILVKECFILFSETCKSETERFNHNLKETFGWCRMTVL